MGLGVVPEDPDEEENDRQFVKGSVRRTRVGENTAMGWGPQRTNKGGRAGLRETVEDGGTPHIKGGLSLR